MLIVPVLDLRDGMAVHARGGDRTRYAPAVSRLAPNAEPGDAAAIAAAYARLGAGAIYVADLDAIAGREPQEALVRACCEAAGATPIWIDAGITSSDGARRWLGLRGVERAVVGLETMAAMHDLARIADGMPPGSVSFSLDLRNGVPVARGDALRRMHPRALAGAAVGAGAANVLLLDLARVGSGAGVDDELARDIAVRIAPVELFVGGGVAAMEDVHRLAALGVAGVLIGSALHDGRIDGGALAQHVSRLT